MTPDLRAHDRVLIACSGGKDSVAALLAVLDGSSPQQLLEAQPSANSLGQG